MPDSSGVEKTEKPERQRPDRTDPPPERLIDWATSAFVQEIDSLATTLPLAMRSVGEAQKTAQRSIDNFIAERNLQRDEVTGAVSVPAEHILHFERLARRNGRTRMAGRLVPRSFLVNLVSQYDAFLGRLIRALLLAKPEVLSASERTISFAELSAYKSIEDARERVIEDAVEAVLRKSHTEQFEWLEKKFGIVLRKDLSAWPEFVEITERRNLFVHTGGKVSAQYLHNCQMNKVESPAKAGDMLGVSATYFQRAYEVVVEVGVKLAHVLWRKLLPATREKADGRLVGITYHLLVERQYAVAKALLDFSRRSEEVLI